jgi:hypothetical protein
MVTCPLLRQRNESERLNHACCRFYIAASYRCKDASKLAHSKESAIFVTVPHGLYGAPGDA